MATLIERYNDLKKMHPKTILLFRAGDFYESYEEDAETISEKLGITLTISKDGYKLTMFPFYELENYLSKLTGLWTRIAICEK